MKLSKSGQQINLTTETTLLAKKTTDLSIVEDSEPHSTTSAFSQHAIPATQTAQTAQKKTIPSGTQQEQATLEQSQQHRPLSTNQIPGGGGGGAAGNTLSTTFQQTSGPKPAPPRLSTPQYPYPGEPLPPGTE